MGSSPKIPAAPGPSAEERQLWAKQSEAIDMYMTSLEDQSAVNKEQGLLSAVASGLYDPVYDGGGRLIDATINPEKVTALQANMGLQEQIGTLSGERYLKALKGELPVSEGLVQQKATEWGLLKEEAARRGIQIEGDDPASAVSKSTSGNELVERFNKTYGLLEDQERRGELSSYSGLLNSTYSTALGTAGSSATVYGPGVAGQGYGAGAGLFGQAAQPYTDYRNLQYNTSVQNAALKSQNQSAQYGLLGTTAGIGIGLLCFDGDTSVEMPDGSARPIRTLSLGDMTRGGKVVSIRQAYTTDLMDYKGVKVTGSHCVKEDGKWKRVIYSPDAKPIPGEHVIYSLITSGHRVFVNGIEFDDEVEQTLNPDHIKDLEKQEERHG